jgi:hypothetical protein
MAGLVDKLAAQLASMKVLEHKAAVLEQANASLSQVLAHREEQINSLQQTVGCLPPMSPLLERFSWTFPEHDKSLPPKAYSRLCQASNAFLPFGLD